jgi:hypothetical protein
VLRRRESYSLRSGIGPQMAGELLPPHGHISSKGDYQTLFYRSNEEAGIIIMGLPIIHHTKKRYDCAYNIRF